MNIKRIKRRKDGKCKSFLFVPTILCVCTYYLILFSTLLMGNHLKTTSVIMYFSPEKCNFLGLLIISCFLLSFKTIFMVNTFSWFTSWNPDPGTLSGSGWSRMYSIRGRPCNTRPPTLVNPILISVLPLVLFIVLYSYSGASEAIRSILKLMTNPGMVCQKVGRKASLCIYLEIFKAFDYRRVILSTFFWHD